MGELKSYSFDDIKSANHPSNSSVVFVGDDGTDSDDEQEEPVKIQPNRNFDISSDSDSSDSESSDLDDIDGI